jgi:hypothetical protein
MYSLIQLPTLGASIGYSVRKGNGNQKQQQSCKIPAVNALEACFCDKFDTTTIRKSFDIKNYRHHFSG